MDLVLAVNSSESKEDLLHDEANFVYSVASALKHMFLHSSQWTELKDNVGVGGCVVDFD